VRSVIPLILSLVAIMAATGQASVEEKKDSRLTWIFSAGGGGKSQNRKAKLEEKNRKLAEERDRTAKEQKKQREKNVTTTRASDDLADVHPDRRAQVPRGSRY
jgi:hypothetical protein